MMKREIYFRRWRTDTNVMEYPFGLVDLGEWQDTSVLMQKTGLQDANGCDVYEGDIVDLHPKENDSIWWREIVWDTGAFHCKQISGKANYPLHFHKHMKNKEWIVIGNIYQGIDKEDSELIPQIIQFLKTK